MACPVGGAYTCPFDLTILILRMLKTVRLRTRIDREIVTQLKSIAKQKRTDKLRQFFLRNTEKRKLHFKTLKVDKKKFKLNL
jgi:hypothetical protein